MEVTCWISHFSPRLSWEGDVHLVVGSPGGSLWGATTCSGQVEGCIVWRLPGYAVPSLCWGQPWCWRGLRVEPLTGRASDCAAFYPGAVVSWKSVLWDVLCFQGPVRSNPPEVTVAVMQELNRRGTLKNALAGRDEKQLSVLLSFLIR